MSRRERIALVAAALVVLLFRVPFIDAGYGSDPDAWRVVHAARHIAATGDYEASRLPGFPLPELTYALVAHSGPVAFNAITALFSVAAFVLLALIAREHAVRRWLLVGLAFAFTPVVFIESTTSMDYVWAVALVLAAYLAALRQRPVLAGVLLGAAIGCRITSGAMLVPVAMIVGARCGGRAVARCAAATAAVAFVAFTPVIIEYGPAFLSVYEEHGYPRLRDVAWRATIEVWGSVGVGGVALWIAAIAWARVAVARRELLAWGAAVVLVGVAFARLPHEAGYLIAAVPFLLLLAARTLPDRAFLAGCCAVIAAPFVSVGWEGPRRGEVLQDHANRLCAVAEAKALVATAAARQPSLIVAGPQLPVLQVLAGDGTPDVRFVYSADEDHVRRARAAGAQVVVLPRLSRTLCRA